MKRREFIALLGGALTSRPIPANAQARVRTVGVMMGLADDAEARAVGAQLTQEDLSTSVWNAGWIGHVGDRERYGADERSLALSIEETRKALGAWPALTPALKCASARESHGRFTGGKAMINSTDASRAQPPAAGRSGRFAAGCAVARHDTPHAR